MTKSRFSIFKLGLVTSFILLGGVVSSKTPIDVNAATITITFDILNDDQVIEDVVLATPGLIEEPAITMRDNVRLIGWFINRGLDEPFSFDTIVSYDIDLFAKWDYLDDTAGKAILTQSLEGTSFKSGDVTLSFLLYANLQDEVTYQWQMKLTSDGEWRDINGATSSTYRPLRNGERGYRLVYRTPVYDAQNNLIDHTRHETSSVWITIYGAFPWLPIIVSGAFVFMFAIVYFLSYKWTLLLIVDGKFFRALRFRAGEDISAIETPIVAEHRFDGWYEDATFTTRKDLTRMPRHALKIYGRLINEKETIPS
ncbi:MAG TPA: hypothetical protein DCX17_04305 [Firmicutes bacterium]|nr:hypothetical protein [Bacillota bacterium]